MTAVPIPPKLWADLTAPNSPLVMHFLRDSVRADYDDYFQAYRFSEKGPPTKRSTDTVPMMSKLYDFLAKPENTSSLLGQLNVSLPERTPTTQTVVPPDNTDVVLSDKVGVDPLKNQQSDKEILKKITDGYNNNPEFKEKLELKLEELKKKEENPMIRVMYSMSLQTLLNMANTFFKAREMVARLATPVVLAIEMTLGIISLLLIGEEALRHQGYRQRMGAQRKFYERASVLVQQLPNVSPVDELEGSVQKTSSEETSLSKKVGDRLRYIMDATSEKSVVQSVEEFLAQFRIVDGTGLDRQPLYTVPVPLHQEHMEFRAKPEDEVGMKIEYMLYPVRVQEFLTQKDKSFTAVPTVPLRKTGSVFSDVEHSLYEIIAVVKEYTDSMESEKKTEAENKKKEEEQQRLSGKPVSNEKEKKEIVDIGQSYETFFNKLRKIAQSIGSEKSMTLRDGPNTLPTNIWQSLHDLFQEEPNKYYLANYFLWAARIIMQSYISWANHELTQEGPKKVIPPSEDRQEGEGDKSVDDSSKTNVGKTTNATSSAASNATSSAASNATSGTALAAKTKAQEEAAKAAALVAKEKSKKEALVKKNIAMNSAAAAVVAAATSVVAAAATKENVSKKPVVKPIVKTIETVVSSKPTVKTAKNEYNEAASSIIAATGSVVAAAASTPVKKEEVLEEKEDFSTNELLIKPKTTTGEPTTTTVQHRDIPAEDAAAAIVAAAASIVAATDSSQQNSKIYFPADEYYDGY
jgi:hypothetical protein